MSEYPRSVCTTERLTIAPISLDDGEFVCELVNTPGWLKNIGDRGVGNPEEAKAFLERGYLKSQKEHGFGYYVARDKNSTPVGVVGFLQRPYLEFPDLGFALLPEFSGIGLAFEMANGVLEYGLNTFRFTAIDAAALPTNTPSIRLLERLNFHHLGEVQTPEQDTLLLFRYQSSSKKF
ncbi:MAG: GNAT family N-acetyltransferase [Pseudomonadota bacterium]